MTEQLIRELFLREYVRHLINYSRALYIPDYVKEKESFKKMMEQIKVKKGEGKIETMMPSIMGRIEEKRTPFVPMQMPPQNISLNRQMKEEFMPSIMQQSERKIPERPMPVRTIVKPKVQSNPEDVVQQLARQMRAMPVTQPHVELFGERGLKLLGSFLVDPSVYSVECTGPGKPILVNKGGIIQTSQIILTQEAINNVIQEVSDKTRIPIVSGAFKAAFENFIITAIISEFVGTRFIIQKIVPFNNLM